MSAESLLPRAIYVNNLTGSDKHDGLSPASAGDGRGPLATVNAAIAKALPGDTIRLAPNHQPYREMIHIRDRAGAPGAPITIDGQGATVSGADPLDPADWEALGDGLYRSTTVPDRIRWDDAVEVRYLLFFAGEAQRMERTSKGPQAPLKAPAELAPGEWTFVAREKALYLRVRAGQSLAEAEILVPVRRNGVGVYGKSAHWVIRNLTCREAINDGFSISGYGEKIRDLRFENIRAINCGDDGISAHGDSAFTVDGFESAGNSTGICDTGNSRTEYNRVFVHGCHGMDVSFILERGMQASAAHTLKNSVVICNAATPFLAVGETPDKLLCEVELENVLFVGPPGGGLVQIGRDSLLRARRVTFLNLDLVAQGSRLELVDSHVGGVSAARLVIAPQTRWQGTGNRYHAAWVQTGGKRYMPEDREKYAETTGDNSAWLKTSQPWTEAGCGADFTHMVQADPVMLERFKAACAAYEAQATQVCGVTKGAAILLAQNFDDQALFPSELRGRVGSRIRQSGRWHTFAANGPLIARDNEGGALRLVRGGGTVVAESLLAARSAQPYVFKCRLYREPGGGMSVTLRDALSLDDAAVLVDGAGKIFLRNFQGSSAWHALDVTLPDKKWAQLAVRVADANVTVMFDGKEVGAALPRNGAGLVPASLIFAPQGTQGAAVMIDDVLLVIE